MRLLLFVLLILSISACNTETIETQNEYGQKVRYERRKEDFAKHGRFERFHDNGQIAEEANYRNDTLDGERKLFYTGGQLESVEYYKMGVLDGPFRRYHESGALYIEQEFRNGVMEGFSLRYYPNGQLEEKVTIRNNEENGPFWEYYENGKIKAEGSYLYEDGAMEQGELKEYDEQGNLVRIADCERGICRTRWKKE